MTSSNQRRARTRAGIVAGLLALCVLAVSCGGGGGSNNSNTSGSSIAQQIATCTQGLPALAVPTTGNSVPVILDSGPCAYGVPFGSPTGTAPSVFPLTGVANVPYTSVTICTPGTTSCQTIDHILVDTGSTGLRLMSSVLSSGVVLPAVTIGAAPLIECIQFADGYSWGSMRHADVHLAGEAASNIPVQVIGDASNYSVPTSCSSTSKNVLNDVVSFGANGVLGVGVFAQDCGPGCVTSISSLYYACPTTASCAESMVPLADQATNPVYAFGTDFNGLLLQFPAVAEGTGAVNVRGTLTFGIGTQSNNQPATVSPSAHIYIADGSADFDTTLLTVTGPYTVTTSTYSNSFIDSGSNGIYIPGTTITADATSGWFIPTTPAAGGNPADVITLTATQRGAGAVGNLNSVTFKIANANTVLFPSGNGSNTVYNGLGAANKGTGSTGGVDWGLPFFLGKSIFVGIEGSTITLGNGESNIGPLWAY